MPVSQLMIGSLGQAGIVVALGVVGAIIFRHQFRPRWFIAAIGLYLVYDFLLTRAYFTVPDLPVESHWNWLGKVMSLTGMLIVASLPAFGWRRVGLTLRQEAGWRSALLVFALLGVVFFYFAITGADGRDDLDTIAFQWTMPGLDEELFYRGVLLLAMNAAFVSRIRIMGAPIGFGGLLTSVLFGLAHALTYDADGFEFDTMTFAMTGGPSLILLWIREKTGSLLLPVLAHNLANGASTLF